MKAKEAEDLGEETVRYTAAEQVDRLSEEELRDASAYVLLSRGIHLGVTEQGERISAADRAVLKRTFAVLKQRLADTYTGGDELDLEEWIGDHSVKEEIFRRAIGVEKDSGRDS